MGVGHTLLLKSASNDDNELSYSILLEILTPVFTRLKTKVLLMVKLGDHNNFPLFCQGFCNCIMALTTCDYVSDSTIAWHGIIM